MKNEQGGEINGKSQISTKSLEAAARLAELSIENTLKIMMLLAGLAKRLLQENLDVADARASTLDMHEIVILRAEHAHETMRLMIEAAHEVAAVGADVRLQFSRLLTEQLASGSNDLMDAFQSFFKVLPAHNADAVEAIERALARSSSAFEQIAALVAESSDDVQEIARRPRAIPKYRRAHVAPAMAPVHHAVEPRAC